jgi:hypothetical protein
MVPNGVGVVEVELEDITGATVWPSRSVLATNSSHHMRRASSALTSHHIELSTPLTISMTV